VFVSYVLFWALHREGNFVNSDDNRLFVNESAPRLYSDTDNKRYTYADYEKWGDDERFELIDGQAYSMAAPSTAHQSISRELLLQFGGFLKGKPCKVFTAPYDVCLYGMGDEDSTVVQPDLIIVCDKAKLDLKRCNGAPDLVIEILSPSYRSHDTLIKLNKYLDAGVKEYWIADPADRTLSVHILSGGHYTINMYGASANVPVHVLDGCIISLREVFAE
jgi:Uma2 family endonuclease